MAFAAALVALGKYADAADAYKALAKETEEDGAAKASLLANAAVCKVECGVLRGALSDAEAAIEADGTQLRAYLCKGAALAARGKRRLAILAWRAGLDAADGSSDAGLIRELALAVARESGAANNSANNHPTTGTAAVEAPPRENDDAAKEPKCSKDGAVTEVCVEVPLLVTRHEAASTKKQPEEPAVGAPPGTTKEDAPIAVVEVASMVGPIEAVVAVETLLEATNKPRVIVEPPSAGEDTAPPLETTKTAASPPRTNAVEPAPEEAKAPPVVEVVASSSEEEPIVIIELDDDAPDDDYYSPPPVTPPTTTTPPPPPPPPPPSKKKKKANKGAAAAPTKNGDVMPTAPNPVKQVALGEKPPAPKGGELVCAAAPRMMSAPEKAAKKNQNKPPALLGGEGAAANNSTTKKNGSSSGSICSSSSSSSVVERKRSVELGGRPSLSVPIIPAAEIPTEVLRAARCSLANRTGNDETDDDIARGYLLVNTGQLEEAIAHFDRFIEAQPRLLAARLGRGSALAFAGDVRRGILDFDTAVKLAPTCVDAIKRRGQSFAALGDRASALRDLDRAVALATKTRHSDLGDILQQRGVMKQQDKDFAAAATDFRLALDLPTPDGGGGGDDDATSYGVIRTRGLRRAVSSSSNVSWGGPDDKDLAQTWNLLGSCETQLGLASAPRCFSAALRLDASFKEAWLNLGHVYRERGESGAALEALDAALRLDGAFASAHIARGLVLYGCGEHARARAAFRAACMHADAGGASGLSRDHKISSMHYAALCAHAVGRYDEAIAGYKAVSRVSPNHVAWYQGELAWWARERLDEALEVSIDGALDPEFKEAHCRGFAPALVANKAPSVLWRKRRGAFEKHGSQRRPTYDARTRRENREAWVQRAAAVEPWIQLDCVGFLPNRRQHRMFAMAALSVAQRVRTTAWGVGGRDASGSNGAGAAGAAAASSSSSSSSSASAAAAGAGDPEAGLLSFPSPSSHRAAAAAMATSGVAWRDLFELVALWRRESEPNDAVWWIDRLAPRAFEDGFGLQTPIVSGQLRVVRYSPYLDRTLNVVKKQLTEDGFAADRHPSPQATAAASSPSSTSSSKKKRRDTNKDHHHNHHEHHQQTAQKLSKSSQLALAECTSLEKLYEFCGGSDFWVAAPCASSITGEALEGTRITVQKHEPQGFNLTIRTPGTPERWAKFDAELARAWVVVTDNAKAFFATDGAAAALASDPAAFAATRDAKKKAAVDAALTIFYYWVSFGPLTRGSAACGYAVLAGILLALGFQAPLPPLPPNLQLDWEAILRPTPQAFIDEATEWLTPNLKLHQDDINDKANDKKNPSDDANMIDALPPFDATFATLEDLLDALKVAD